MGEKFFVKKILRQFWFWLIGLMVLELRYHYIRGKAKETNIHELWGVNWETFLELSYFMPIYFPMLIMTLIYSINYSVYDETEYFCQRFIKLEHYIKTFTNPDHICLTKRDEQRKEEVSKYLTEEKITSDNLYPELKNKK